MDLSAVLSKVPAAHRGEAQTRLVLQDKIQRIFPGFRIKVFLPKDQQLIGGLPVEFAALIMNSGRRVVFLQAPSFENLLLQARAQDNGQKP